MKVHLTAMPVLMLLLVVAPGLASEPAVQGPPLSPMMEEIQALVVVQKEALEELRARLESAVDDESALAIQKEVGELKKEIELGILGVQLKYARLEGREETATKIEQAIETLRNPRPVPEPQPRPAPPLVRQ
jgi:hypothetical protein